MPKKTKPFGAGDAIGVVLRRKRIVLIAAAVVSAIAFTVTATLPDSYRGQTLLVIDPSKVPEKFMDGVKWFPPVDERLETLFQAARARRELRAICDKFGLYEPEDASFLERRTPLGPLVKQLLGEAPDRLSRALTADVLPTPPGRGPKEQRILQVAFTHEDPATAAAVTNAFAFRLADLEHEFSVAHLDNAIAFLENSGGASQEAIDAKTRELLDFKRLQEETLPERAPELQRQLESLRGQSLATERAVSEAESRIDGYTRTMDAYVQQSANGTDSANFFGLTPGVAVDRRLEVLRTQIGELTLALADLRIRNLDTHPDVRRVAALLEAAKVEYQTLSDGLAAPPPAAGHDPSKEAKDPAAALAKIPPGSPLFAAYSGVFNLREGERRQIEILRRELIRLQGEQARVELLLAKVPETERKLARIESEYEALKKTNDERQAQLEQTRTMREVERQRKSEQLRVIEPAEASPIPYGPDRLKIALLGVVLALAAGGGAAFLKESRDTSFRTAEDAADRLEVPVLAALPKIGA